MICTDKFPYSELEGYPRNQVIAYYEKAGVAGESVVYIPFLAAISTAAIFRSLPTEVNQEVSSSI